MIIKGKIEWADLSRLGLLSSDVNVIKYNEKQDGNTEIVFFDPA